MSLVVPPWITAYRKVLVVSAVALASGAAGWTINGWRKGRELAQVQLAHSQAEVRRSVAVGVEWQQATRGALDSLAQARQLLQQERAKNAVRQASVRSSQPTGADYACRDKPLPESYLETFRK